MSEAPYLYHTKNAFEIGNNRSSEWRNLRLMVSRDSTEYLTVALVEQAKGGHPRLDGRIRGLQVAWYPKYADYDLRLYALTTALAGVSQTRS